MAGQAWPEWLRWDSGSPATESGCAAGLSVEHATHGDRRLGHADGALRTRASISTMLDMRAPKRPSPDGLARQLVRRKCLVCEWEGEQVERPGLDPDCPWCHAPTDALEVLPLPGGVTLSDMPAGKNPFASALGRLGAKKGGEARARALSPRRRKQIAQQAAKARWSKKR